MKKILFLGGDKLSAICLRKILSLSSSFSTEVWSTSPDSEPSVLAKSENLQFHTEPLKKMKDWEILNQPLSYDFLLIASFGLFVPAKLIRVCGATINAHPSLLPKYRGASPIQYTILNQDTEAGVSLITVDETKFDAGRILRQEKLENYDYKNANYDTLRDSLGELAGNMLVEAVNDYPRLLESSFVQDNAIELAPKITNSQCKIDFSQTSEDVFALFRCLKGSNMHSFFYFRNKRIVPFAMRRVSQLEEEELVEKYPGAQIGLAGCVKKRKEKTVFIKCTDRWIGLCDFNIEGKKYTKNTISEFIGTYLLKNTSEFSFY